jgi:hypothetical protein
MRALLLLLVPLFMLACSPPYGRQSCSADSECPMGQFCPSNKADPKYTCDVKPDAGTDVKVSALCQKACASDADCNGLGLKKPKCVTLVCAAGAQTCVDFPF